jgi:hypothetical protein
LIHIHVPHLKPKYSGSSNHEQIYVCCDPVLARSVKYNPEGSALADVDYETSHGTVPVHGLYLSAERVHRLVQGGGIPLRYMKSDPHRYLEEGVELPSGIGLLAGLG